MAKKSVEVHPRAVIADNDLTRSGCDSFELDHNGRRISVVSIFDQLRNGQHIVAMSSEPMSFNGLAWPNSTTPERS